MKRSSLQPILLAALFILGSVLTFTSCNSSPTVPVPPPTMTKVTTTDPDNLGYVTVIGEANAAKWGDIVLVFNDNTGVGAMKDAEIDGSFEVAIAAQKTHVLVLQIMRNAQLSDPEEITVE